MSLRVFELAKELNIPTKELIKKIKHLGIEISGNFSALSDKDISQIKKDFLEPSAKLEDEEVPSQVSLKKTRRRIISSKKDKEPKKLKAAVKEEEPIPEEDEEIADEKGAEVELTAGEEGAKEKAPKRIIRKKGAAKEAPEVEEEKPKKQKAAVKETKAKTKAKTKAETKAEKTEVPKEEAKKVKKDREPTKRVSEKKKLRRTRRAPIPEEMPIETEPVQKEPIKVTVRKKRAEVGKPEADVKKDSKDAEKKGKTDKEKADIKLRKKDKKQEKVIEKEKPLDEYDKKQIKSLQKKEKVKLDKRSIRDKLEVVVEEDFSIGFEDEPLQPPPPPPKTPRYPSKRRMSKAAKRKEKAKKQAEAKKDKHVFNPRQKELVVGEFITVGDLAGLIGIKVPEIIKTLMSLGVMATITQSIDGETAALVASEHGIELKVQFESIEDAIEVEVDEESDLTLRPPVVTIMGHVDHGKTSLLDKIRKSNVTDDEAGGITQHIGAYHVKSPEGSITFLDTPGHEAFTAMRARGANVTDIVILVVAADDGPRPQTVEAIHHAKAAEVAIIVAINKCDKPDANPDKTIQQLMEYELVPEEFGGDVPTIKVSAKKGDGIKKLLEMVHLQAEIMELKANSNRMALGTVIESKVDKGRGNAATILIQNGTLKVGDNYVVGTEYGRVRAMWNDKGKKITEATPAVPVEIVGLNGVPKAGDPFNVGQDEKQVRQIAMLRTEKDKERRQAQQQKRTLENLFDTFGSEEKSILNLVIKTDVNGSLDALSDALERLGNDQVAINIIYGAVGAISRNDVLLAITSKAIVIGFNTRPDPSAKTAAQEESIDVRLYSVIYEVIEDVRQALEGMLKPIVREEIQGKAEVLEVFNIPKIGVVAGSKIVEGKFLRDSSVRVIRDNVIIHDGRLSSLQRFKDSVKEVQTGFECGIGVESFKDIRTGDELESFTRLETAAKL